MTAPDPGNSPGVARSRPLAVGSLFTGIGGIDVGLERAGMTVSWMCEADPYCRSVLARHWPTTTIYEDVKDVDDRAPRVDVVAGGFPCQPVSRNGLRRGEDDARWLWPEFHRVVRELRPRFVLVENVPGLLDGGLGRVLGDLAESGYDAEWDCLPAAAVGATHLRDRLFLVAYPAGSGRQGDAPAGEVWGREQPSCSPWWVTEPRLARLADGVPGRVVKRRARIHAAGNAVVPQVAEFVGRRIVALAAASDDAEAAA